MSDSKNRKETSKENNASQQETLQEKPKKNLGGRPRKDGTMWTFYLASDVDAILRELNPEGTKGQATQFVEDAIREKAKKRPKK